MLDSFKTYLLKHEFANTTIDSYCKTVKRFLTWCNQVDYDVEMITYTQWLDYQQLIKSKTNRVGSLLKDRSVGHDIGVIRVFFDFLVFEDLRNLNPIKDKFYKVDSDFYHDLLSEIELHELYISYPTLDLNHPKCPSVAIRNKVIIGLVVFQAINTTTLSKLNVEHIDLGKKKIHIPGTSRSNSRVLKLEDVQLIHLRQYLEHDRAILQTKINCHTEALFPLNTPRFSSITSDITRKLKTLNLKVTNLKQIRASVITLWVQAHDLRRAQIMCGIRYISSIEKYQRTDLDSLEEATLLFHPMQ